MGALHITVYFQLHAEFFKDHIPFDFVITKIHSYITRVDIMIMIQSKDSNADYIATIHTSNVVLYYLQV